MMHVCLDVVVGCLPTWVSVRMNGFGTWESFFTVCVCFIICRCVVIGMAVALGIAVIDLVTAYSLYLGGVCKVGGLPFTVLYMDLYQPISASQPFFHPPTPCMSLGMVAPMAGGVCNSLRGAPHHGTRPTHTSSRCVVVLPHIVGSAAGSCCGMCWEGYVCAYV